LGDERTGRAAPWAMSACPSSINSRRRSLPSLWRSLYTLASAGHQSRSLGQRVKQFLRRGVFWSSAAALCSIAYGIGGGAHRGGDRRAAPGAIPASCSCADLAEAQSIFSLFMHLPRDLFHPTCAHAGWLRRLLSTVLTAASRSEGDGPRLPLEGLGQGSSRRPTGRTTSCS